MPVYDYHCTVCGHDFIQVESFAEHENAKPVCPECNSDQVKRVITPPRLMTTKKS